MINRGGAPRVCSNPAAFAIAPHMHYLRTSGAAADRIGCGRPAPVVEGALELWSE
jgi:hypothetical protein